MVALNLRELKATIGQAQVARRGAVPPNASITDLAVRSRRNRLLDGATFSCSIAVISTFI